ncbi:unnamed protein product [Schistocephalus solidus]|uniref:FBD domain-containing protein n=1 Tax=Schistocephalus solidus TaxID=70667 RepID=A0A183TJD9_SCHSO|nr:unnamed protein product [Schistocephalus solidus]
MDPKDRRKVEYWNDKKFTKYFEEGGEEGLAARKKKKKKKSSKPEKPLVRLLPFIDTLRNHRYCQIKELFVWDVYVDHSDMMCLVISLASKTSFFQASMLLKGCYDLELIELVDCFINQKALEVATPSQLHLRQHGMDAEDSGPLQDFRVRDPVLQSQLQYSAEAAEMEVIQLPGLVQLEGPGFRSGKECRQDDDLVHLQFGVQVNTVAIPHVGLQPAECLTSFGDPLSDPIVDSRVA